MSRARRPPGVQIEQSHWQRDECVVGFDEVGKGSWAGPLVVGAAVIPLSGRVNGIRDSKQLTFRQREDLFGRLADWCTAWSVGAASAMECDQLGMSAAQRLAAERALAALDAHPAAAIVDGKWNFLDGIAGAPPRVHMRVKGESVSRSIATASILAKVTRDRMMIESAASFPYYNFESNKGYPCPLHRIGLDGYGPSAIHRRSWAFMDRLVWTRRPRQPTQMSLLG